MLDRHFFKIKSDCMEPILSQLLISDCNTCRISSAIITFLDPKYPIIWNQRHPKRVWNRKSCPTDGIIWKSLARVVSVWVVLCNLKKMKLVTSPNYCLQLEVLTFLWYMQSFFNNTFYYMFIISNKSILWTETIPISIATTEIK